VSVDRDAASERLMRQGLAPSTSLENRAPGCSNVTTSGSGSIIAGLLQMKFG
jgi:hypothetical protein